MNKMVLLGSIIVVACDPFPPSAVVLVAPVSATQVQVRACEPNVPAYCSDIRRACSQRGFFAGGYTQRRGIKYDCLDVLLRGGAVDGVDVPPDEIACVRSRALRAAQQSSDVENDFENECIYSTNELASGGIDRSRACEAIDQACYAAGYYFGGAAQGRGVQADCLQPLYAGETVPRLRVATPIVRACFGAHLDDRAGFDLAMSRAADLAPAP